MRYIKFLLAFLLFSGTIYAGGGWPQKKGEGFFLLSQRSIVGNGYYGSEGLSIGSPRLSALTTHFYGEYGITDKFTAVLHSPFITALSRDAGLDGMGNIFIADNDLGFGDIDAAIKYNILSKPLFLSAELTLGIPSGNYNGGQTETLHLGDGEFNQMLRVYASKGFKYGIFATAFGAFNNRTNGFSDEFHYGGELGISQFGLTLIGKLYVRQSLFNEPRKDSPIPGIYSDNLEYFSFGFQALYKFRNWGVMFEQGTANFGRNIIAALSYSGGIFFELKQKEKKSVPVERMD